MRIIDLVASQETYVNQAAEILWQSFHGRSLAWPTMCAARREVLDSLAPERVSRVMVHDTQGVVGWIGAIPQYDGHVWELHPLVVAKPWRRRGIGRALVSDLETIVAGRGALTLWLGSDDENYETTLGGADLYEDLPERLRKVRAW
ncbi:MAG: GNAT family N-acetyltransferase, partial [Limnochordia bacterium]